MLDPHGKRGRALDPFTSTWTPLRNCIIFTPLCRGTNMRSVWCWLFHRRWRTASVVGYFDAECWCSRCEEYRLGLDGNADAWHVHLDPGERRHDQPHHPPVYAEARLP